jgi:hypothetical protein
MRIEKEEVLQPLPRAFEVGSSGSTIFSFDFEMPKYSHVNLNGVCSAT